MAVLVVDDDATVVNLVTAVLHRAGIQAEVALDGPSALVRLGRGGYRAVLSDLTMPGMSGLQLLREARERGHTLPFLIMTAYLVPEAEITLRAEPGVVGLLRKPFDIRRLVDEVSAVLRAVGAADEAAKTAEIVEAAETTVSVHVGTPADRVEIAEPVVEGVASVEKAEVIEVIAVAAPAEIAVAQDAPVMNVVAVDTVVFATAETITVQEAGEADVAATPADAAALNASTIEVHAPEISVATSVAPVMSVAPVPLVAVVDLVDVAAPAEVVVLAEEVVSAESSGGPLLPLSLVEYVTMRLRRQALIAQAERRAAALRARPLPVRRHEAVASRELLREAEQGC